MKTLIIEGLDRTGKSTLIEGICKFYEYDNIMVRHCGKPPKKIKLDEVYKWQMQCFIKEGKLNEYIHNTEFNEFNYYENKIIYNRYYLGEYVYGILYREYKEEFIAHRIKEFESQYINFTNTYLITLIADPEFLMNNEDGNSFAKNLEQKSQEIELFKSIHEKSSIINKLLLRVDNGIGEYLPNEQILNTVLNFIK